MQNSIRKSNNEDTIDEKNLCIEFFIINNTENPIFFQGIDFDYSKYICNKLFENGEEK